MVFSQWCSYSISVLLQVFSQSAFVGSQIHYECIYCREERKEKKGKKTEREEEIKVERNVREIIFGNPPFVEWTGG